MQVSSLVLSGAALQAVLASVFAVGMWILLGGSGNAGTVVGLLAVGIRYHQGLALAIEHTMALRTAQLDLQRIQRILDARPLAQPIESADAPMPGTVDLEEVTFGYGDTPVVRDVTLHAAPGTMVALVGPSGAGKSTLLSLIARFHDAGNGTVRVGGRDVREQATDDLMRQLSLVFQDAYLFDDTLEANIRLGRPEASDEEMTAAAAAAGVSEIVHRLSHGWKSRVGEGGSALSGGERQRVALARALLKQAPILLLDEATAALDPENERHVTASLQALRRQTTTLVIAHRLHTIAHSDAIVLLSEDGRVVDQGTHEELLGRCGDYGSFWRSREVAEQWQIPATGTSHI